MDRLSKESRSENMRKIKSKNTAPELQVRKFLFSRGLRYRLHHQKLPGKPDLVFSRARICVFVHGCFWHGCTQCVDGTRSVKTHSAYWTTKITTNRERDRRHTEMLRSSGWRVIVIWECETKDVTKMENLFQQIKDPIAPNSISKH